MMDSEALPHQASQSRSLKFTVRLYQNYMRARWKHLCFTFLPPLSGEDIYDLLQDPTCDERSKSLALREDSGVVSVVGLREVVNNDDQIDSAALNVTN